jgi:hypothetical protein
MTAFFMTVSGKRSFPVGGFKEIDRGFSINTSKSEGIDVQPFSSRVLCREGNEPSEIAPKGTRCSAGLHQVKEGTLVYNIGISRVCPAHIRRIPTLKELQNKYHQPWFLDVVIAQEKKE